MVKQTSSNDDFSSSRTWGSCDNAEIQTTDSSTVELADQVDKLQDSGKEFLIFEKVKAYGEEVLSCGMTLVYV
jgi:hypothetical protein